MLKEVQFLWNAKITDTYVFSIAIFTFKYTKISKCTAFAEISAGKKLSLWLSRDDAMSLDASSLGPEGQGHSGQTARGEKGT